MKVNECFKQSEEPIIIIIIISVKCLLNSTDIIMCIHMVVWLLVYLIHSWNSLRLSLVYAESSF